MMEKIILLPCQVVSKMNILIIFKMLLDMKMTCMLKAV